MRSFEKFILSLLFVGVAGLGPVGAQTLSTGSAPQETAIQSGLEGVGRLDIVGPNGLRGFCTALLVSPSEVLTAAHCLYDPTTDAAFVPEEMAFRAGLRGTLDGGTRGVSRVTVHPDYEFSPRPSYQSIRTDLALVHLDFPLELPEVETLRSDQAVAKGDGVQLVSYALGREDVPEVEQDCHVLDRDDSVLVLSCSIDYGSSGAPVFVRHDGRLQVISVISAMSHWHDRPVAMAVIVQSGLTDLRLAARQGDPQRPTLPQVATVSNRGETGTIRFHRPAD